VVTVYPAAGYRDHPSGAIAGLDTYGVYWSFAVTGVNAYSLEFHSAGVRPIDSGARAYGFSVRCVQYLQ
jgi:hypothetical protein